MKKFEFLHHTADVKFIAYGKNLESAFSNAALATFTIMTDLKKVKPKTKKTLNIKAKRKESLLYDFLQELIFLLDTEGFLLRQVKELKIEHKTDYILTATLEGDNADAYEVHTYIKSVTYSDMFIKEESGLVKTQVVHDI